MGWNHIENTEISLYTTKESGLEIGAEKTKYMYVLWTEWTQ